MSQGRRPWTPVLAAAAVAVLVGALGGAATDTGPWYQALQKPSWQPPGWLFAPVWTVIYALTVGAFVVAWRHAPDPRLRRSIIALFALNAVFNVAWSVIFFRLHRPDWALVEVALLWLSILMLILLLARISATASRLLVPYILWVSFAAILNLAVVRLNYPFQAS
jgi:tryptophan-rich sensory protein